MTFPQKSSRAFTLAEAMIALAVIALLSALAYPAMQVANQNAMKARLMTLADELARNQIDQIETSSPFNPQYTPAQIPTVLATGTSTSTVPLYIDPNTGTTQISATLTTTIQLIGSYNAVAGTVTVAYQYHGKSYQVQMNTIRCSDNL
jgi:prepilin-type N-terminal cleavage/methylation domain-containing protein